MPRPLNTNPFIHALVRMDASTEALAGYIDSRPGTVRATVVSVDDPDENGRVKVVFDDFNPDVPQVINAGEWSERREGEDPPHSHWIDTVPAFKGKQPPGLVGKRVEVSLSNGQYQGAVLKDVLYDPDSLTEEAGGKLKIPNNSTMTRIPVYPQGQLPKPCEENHGCTVIEETGPMNSDWVCVCLKRDGQYIWVRHADLAHGHAGGNDITQQVDSSGNRPSVGQMPAVWDYVFVTSHEQPKYFTAFGTSPRGNPWGEDAGWSPPPMSDILPAEFEPGTLFDQNTAVDFVRQTGFPDSIAGSFSSSFLSQIPIGTSSIPGLNVVGDALSQAQKALAISEKVQGAIKNPQGFIAKEATSSLGGGFIPQATSYAVASVSRIGSIASGAISSVTNFLGSISG